VLVIAVDTCARGGGVFSDSLRMRLMLVLGCFGLGDGVGVGVSSGRNETALVGVCRTVEALLVAVAIEDNEGIGLSPLLARDWVWRWPFGEQE